METPEAEVDSVDTTPIPKQEMERERTRRPLPLPGLLPDGIRSGISQPRNKNLPEMFHRLHLIESYGR